MASKLILLLVHELSVANRDASSSFSTSLSLSHTTPTAPHNKALDSALSPGKSIHLFILTVSTLNNPESEHVGIKANALVSPCYFVDNVIKDHRS